MLENINYYTVQHNCKNSTYCRKVFLIFHAHSVFNRNSYIRVKYCSKRGTDCTYLNVHVDSLGCWGVYIFARLRCRIQVLLLHAY